MREEKYIISIVAIVCILSIVTLVIIDSNSIRHNPYNSGPDRENNIGFAAHPIYSSFEQPIAKFTVDKNAVIFSSADTEQSLTIITNDTAVYNKAYISINSGAWLQINLSGTALSTQWVTGNAQATINIPKSSTPDGISTDNYIIIYSCTRNSTGWDCHENKWQLQTFNISKNTQSTPNITYTQTVVYAINSGGSAYTDSDGTAYTADNYYSGGSSAIDDSAPTGNPLYDSERYGTFQYNLPVSNGNYQVTLKFAETYFWSAGSRVFNVDLQGQRVMTNLDILQVAGHAVPYDQTFNITVINSKINISFTPSIEEPKISAIKITTLTAGTTNNTNSTNTTQTCTGSSSQSCTITNGVGTQTRTCNTSTGTWGTPLGVCTIVSCNSGYFINGTVCSSSTCSGSSTQSCAITNGVGTQTRTCNNGTWGAPLGTCTVASCNSGYTQEGNTCINASVLSGSCPTCLRNLISGDQSFVVPSDAPNNEYVGIVKAYPEYVLSGATPVFTLIGGKTSRYSLSSTGLIQVKDNTGLSGAASTYDSILVNVSKTGFLTTTINVSIQILNSANCVYIDPSAGTNGAGTRANPKNNNADLTDPGIWTANKVYLFKRGTSFKHSYKINIQVPGVIIASYGTGALPIIEQTTSNDNIIGSGSITLRDIELYAADSQEYDYSFADATGYINMLHCKIDGGGQAFRILASPTVDAKVLWNDIGNMWTDGVYVYTAKSLEVGGNYIHNVNLCHPADPDDGDIIQIDDIPSVWVHHNYMDHSTEPGKFCLLLGTADPNFIGNAIVEYNVMKRSRTGTDNTITYTNWAKGSNITYRYNKFQDALLAIQSRTNDLQIYYNTFDNLDVVMELNAPQTPSTVKFSNNVIYNSGVVLYGYGENIDFKNNIVSTITGSAFQGGNNQLLDYNDYYNVPTFGNVDKGLHDLTNVNPQFIDSANGDFRIQNTSQCIGKGINVGLTKDINGLPVKNPPSMGVSELYNN